MQAGAPVQQKEAQLGRKIIAGLSFIIVVLALIACTPYPAPMTATPDLGYGTPIPTFTPGPSPTTLPTVTQFPSPTPPPVQPSGAGGAATPFAGE